MDMWQRWKQTTIANKALVLSGAIVAVGTMVSTGALVIQICIGRENNRKTSEQVDKIIQAANTQASAAQQIADASVKAANAADKSASAATEFALYAKGINEQTRIAVGHFRTLAEATKGQVEITRNDQRAWVGVVDVISTPPLPIQAGSAYAVQPRIENTGRTPALKVTYQFATETRPDDQPPTLQYFNRPEGHAAVIMPGQNVGLGGSLVLYPAAFTQAQVDVVNKGGVHLYMFGAIHYSDIFGFKHTSTFCFRYDPASARFGTCESYNEAD